MLAMAFSVATKLTLKMSEEPTTRERWPSVLCDIIGMVTELMVKCQRNRPPESDANIFILLRKVDQTHT
jgi:hypothetical protein